MNIDKYKLEDMLVMVDRPGCYYYYYYYYYHLKTFYNGNPSGHIGT